ncbi:alpha/beta hydrolase [Marinobacter sp. M216]|uniref:Alpha/beta hydrolase n=1 Tax=Marinobacter albus TaxID=3030833 RepID=A0ABT7HCY9_9GAMM|nr:alpha/beta hydrolase [Marinobacter sp. M216]MDK9558223.1 alpha/beta hydrolase [Marinobacter sp. M216]
MPAPDVYGDGLLNPLPETEPFQRIPYDGILFATDRAPATGEDPENYYLNDRGFVVRVGLAEIQFGKKEFSWEFARQVSMLKTRTEDYPVKITGVEEWGMMKSSLPNWIDTSLLDRGELPEDASDRFAKAINAQLAVSGKKHVYIYVHGYKVVFENPVLVSAELWHFLGYEGAFIAYAWPSTPSRFAYIKDSDTSEGFARSLRVLLEFIAQETDAEEVHVIGYSNGTRLVLRALEQLALKHHSESEEVIHEKLRISNVILVGSDLDRGVFGAFISDGLLKVPRRTSVYVSDRDKALGFSQFLTRRQRLGQLWGGAGDEMLPLVRQALIDLSDQLAFINVSEAEASDLGNGHGYFLSSPWASSDILMTLYYGLTPQQRGLLMQEDMPVYTFPPDYILRLWDAIDDVDPAFAAELEALRASEVSPTE